MIESDKKIIASVFRKAKICLAKNAKECEMRSDIPGTTYKYQEYICYAIETVDHRVSAKLQALFVIDDRLGDCYSLETWVLRNIPNVGYPVNKDEMQAYRHRWLDALIEEFSQ